jgi:(2Fe-2S) ferredoxin
MRQPEARVGVTGTECLGPCFDGPNAVIYPEGVWYAGLVPDDAAAILDGSIAIDKRHPWSDEDDE